MKKRIISCILALALLLGSVSALQLIAETPETGKKSLKVLTIGCSFGVDGNQYFYDVAKSAGYDATIAYTYIGGAEFEDYLLRIHNDPTYCNDHVKVYNNQDPIYNENSDLSNGNWETWVYKETDNETLNLKSGWYRLALTDKTKTVGGAEKEIGAIYKKGESTPVYYYYTETPKDSAVQYFLSKNADGEYTQDLSGENSAVSYFLSTQSERANKVKNAIGKEDWDYIVLQSGEDRQGYENIAFLKEMYAYFKKIAAENNNDDVKIAYHMTWEYPSVGVYTWPQDRAEKDGTVVKDSNGNNIIDQFAAYPSVVQYMDGYSGGRPNYENMDILEKYNPDDMYNAIVKQGEEIQNLNEGLTDNTENYFNIKGSTTSKSASEYNNYLTNEYGSDVNISNITVIPSGTSVHNIKTIKWFKENHENALYRDCIHMNLYFGRYVAAMTFFKTLTGDSLDNVKTNIIHGSWLKIAKAAVNAACENKFASTDLSSQFPVEYEEVDTSVYTEVENKATNCEWDAKNNLSNFSTSVINGKEPVYSDGYYLPNLKTEYPTDTDLAGKKSAIKVLTDASSKQILFDVLHPSYQSRAYTGLGVRLVYDLTGSAEKNYCVDSFEFVQGNVGLGLEASYEIYVGDEMESLFDNSNRIYAFDAKSAVADAKAKAAADGVTDVTTIRTNYIQKLFRQKVNINKKNADVNGRYFGIVFTDYTTWDDTERNNNATVHSVYARELGVWGTEKSVNNTVPEAVKKENVSVDGTNVTVKTEYGYEYSIDGINWQKSGVFANLEPHTFYNLYQRIAETETEMAGPASEPLAITTEKYSATAPTSAPEIDNTTENSVTLKTVNGMQYSCDGGNSWQDSNIFYALDTKQTYRFCMRVKETEETMPSLSGPVYEYRLSKIEGEEYISSLPSDVYSDSKVNWTSVNNNITTAYNNTGNWTESLIYGKDAYNSENTSFVYGSSTNKASVRKALTDGTNNNGGYGKNLGLPQNSVLIYDLGKISEITKFAFSQTNAIVCQEAAYKVYIGNSGDEEDLIKEENLVFTHNPKEINNPEAGSVTNLNGSDLQKIEFASANAPVGRYVAIKIISGNTNRPNATIYPREIGVWGSPYEANSDKAEAPVIESFKNGKVTLKAVEGYEYSDGINGWQFSNVFDVSAGKQYRFYQRIAEKTGYAPSKASDAVPFVVTTGIKGDANADSKFDICDLVYINEYINKTVEAVSSDADVNKDGVIDVNDMTEVRKLLLNLN